MYYLEAVEEYKKALRKGKKEYKECQLRGESPNPAVLDEILQEQPAGTYLNIGLLDIPMSRIVGVKSAGRIAALTRDFLPLLETTSEFSAKWIRLCSDHLSDEGIRNPIECYEYLGDFYVQEGNKRVSVLRWFGAARIQAYVTRVMPEMNDTPRIRAYGEFLEFYKISGLYDLQFTTPGSYHRLLQLSGYPQDRAWTEDERRRFRSNYYYFAEAFDSLGEQDRLPTREKALLLWLEVNHFRQLAEMTAPELKKSITQLWPNLLAVNASAPVVKTEPPEEKNVLMQLIKGADSLNVAFIHKYNPERTNWTKDHEAGRQYMENALGKAVTTQVFMNVNTPEEGERCIDQAVENGADVVFTTAPQLIGPCMAASVRHPKVRFLNCSLQQPYASVRTYYSRIFEGKFITGAIAGIMSKNGRIGYVGSYPIRGVAASINAFALGAQLTNPQAKIYLKWACVPGNPTQEFLADGIRVISNRDTPTKNHLTTDFGTYYADDEGNMKPLGSPVWMWGPYYEHVVRSILSGSWEQEKTGKIVNLWWGMDSGVIDVKLAEELPEGVKTLAKILKEGICSGRIDPFARPIRDQKGNLVHDGSRPFTPVEQMQLDWLCENVVGGFPDREDLVPAARSLVELLGVDTPGGNV